MVRARARVRAWAFDLLMQTSSGFEGEGESPRPNSRFYFIYKHPLYLYGIFPQNLNISESSRVIIPQLLDLLSFPVLL